MSRYYANTETYLKAVALKRMPPNLQAVDMLKAGKMAMSALINILLIVKSAPFIICLMSLCVTATPVPEPCLDSFVFLRVKERQENILIEPETDEQRCLFYFFKILSPCVVILLSFQQGECYLPTLCVLGHRSRSTDVLFSLSHIRDFVVDLEEGSQHLMRYRTIAPLVLSGAVQLI